MPNPFDPNSYGQPSFEDLMVGALTESAARAKMEADERAVVEQLTTPGGPWTDRKAQQPDVGMREATTDGMPVYDKTGAYVTNAMDLGARAERGQPIPPHILQGMSVPEAAQSLGSGMGMRALNAQGHFDPSMPTAPPMAEGREWDPVYTPPRDPSDIRMERAHKLDDFAGGDGLPAGVFQDRSAVEAMQMLADQLRQRRYGLGDDLAWLADGMTDI
jgi:hypothetical protein